MYYNILTAYYSIQCPLTLHNIGVFLKTQKTKLLSACPRLVRRGGRILVEQERTQVGVVRVALVHVPLVGDLVRIDAISAAAVVLRDAIPHDPVHLVFGEETQMFLLLLGRQEVAALADGVQVLVRVQDLRGDKGAATAGEQDEREHPR